MGVTVHSAAVGRTALQPAMVGDAMHWAMVGNMVPHPTSFGLAVHCESVGGAGGGGGGAIGEFKNACLVIVPPVTEPVVLMASPALNKTAPVVDTVPIALTVNTSLALPVGPASSVIAPPLTLVTDPSTVKGLCVLSLILPALVDTDVPAFIDVAPMLSTMMLPVLPGVDCARFWRTSAPVLLIFISVFAPELVADSEPICVTSAVPFPMPPVATAFRPPPAIFPPACTIAAPAFKATLPTPALITPPTLRLPVELERLMLPPVAVTPDRLYAYGETPPLKLEMLNVGELTIVKSPDDLPATLLILFASPRLTTPFALTARS